MAQLQRIVVFTLALLAFGWWASEAVAADAAPPSSNDIAIIDIQHVLQRSKAATSVRPKIEQLRKEFQDQVRQQEQELRQAEQELSQQRAILSPDAFQTRRRAFEERARAAQRKVQDRRQQLDKMWSKAIGEVQRHVIQISAKIAQERNLALILPKRMIVIANTKLDISDEVLKRLDAQLPTLQLEVPPKP